MFTISAKVPQHRVKHPFRDVLYRHTTAQAQRERVVPFRPIENVGDGAYAANSAIHWQEPDQSWHLHCDASLVSPENVIRIRRKEDNRKIRTRRTQVLNKGIATSTNTLVKEPTGDGDFLLSQEMTESNNGTRIWNISTHVEFSAENTTSSNATSNTTSSAVYSTSASSENITSNPYQPIRIRTILSENSWLTDNETSILFQDILSPAILAWSAALRADPIIGNLTIDAGQLYDGETCGPGKESGYPSVKVPLHHLNDGIGISDTDFVIYLSLAFLDASGEANSTDGFELTQIPVKSNNSLLEFASNFPSQWPLEYQSNLTDTLFGDDVGGTNLGPNAPTKPVCTGEYLAAATYCATDQYDRPTASMLHLCIDDTFFSDLDKNIVTVMHEIGHALGFNPHSMAHFRTHDGLPITERDDEGNVVDVAVKCAGVGHQTQLVPLPSTDILRFRLVRNGVRVAEIVTPTVRQVVRNHFDCQSLQGAELESRLDETGGSCLGEHWERRLFREDLMNPVVDDVAFTLKISSITLALFADSGWYQVDLSRAAAPAGWGRGTGCPFVDNTCITSDGSVSNSNAAFFCNQTIFYGCSPDMTRKAACNIDWHHNDLPPQYQYFHATLGSGVGGQEAFIDYCPVYSGFSNGECSSKSTENSGALKMASFEDFGVKNSRCLFGSVQGASTALCLQIACVVDDRTLRVKLGGTWRLCNKAGEKLIVDSDENFVACPDPVRTCPTFYCSLDCLGTGGICDFLTGDCLCSVQTTNSTASNATVLIPCQEMGSVSNSSDVRVFFDFAVDGNTNSVDTLLSDYYVSTSNELKNDQVSVLGKVGIILVSSSGFVFLAFIVMGVWWYTSQCAFHFVPLNEFLRYFGLSAARDPAVPTEIEVPRSNKDKFVASLLLNLRVHYPQHNGGGSIVSALETISETDGSCSQSSAPFSNSSLSVDSESNLDEVPRKLNQAVKKQKGEMHPVNIMRRRFKAGDCLE